MEQVLFLESEGSFRFDECIPKMLCTCLFCFFSDPSRSIEEVVEWLNNSLTDLAGRNTKEE